MTGQYGAIIGAMADIQTAPPPLEIGARHYARMAALAYTDFLRHASVRSPAMNQQCLAEALVYAERSVSLGTDENKIEESFRKLRAFWVQRLGKERTA